MRHCSLSVTKFYVLRYGYVDFKTHEEAKKAVENPVKVFGNLLNLDMAVYRPDKAKGMHILSRHVVQFITVTWAQVEMYSEDAAQRLWALYFMSAQITGIMQHFQA